MNTIKKQVIFYSTHILLLIIFIWAVKYPIDNAYLIYLNYFVFIITFYFASTVKKTSLKQFIFIEMLMVLIILANLNPGLLCFG